MINNWEWSRLCFRSWRDLHYWICLLDALHLLEVCTPLSALLLSLYLCCVYCICLCDALYRLRCSNHMYSHFRMWPYLLLLLLYYEWMWNSLSLGCYCWCAKVAVVVNCSCCLEKDAFNVIFCLRVWCMRWVWCTAVFLIGCFSWHVSYRS